MLLASAISLMLVTATPFHGDSLALRDTLQGGLIGESVVSARREPAAITGGQVLEGAELRKMSGYSVADAVRFLSGVQVKDYGGIGGLKTINVRSIGSEHTAVEYNGIELTNAQNGIIDLGRISLVTADKITLSSGGRGDILRPARSFASASTLSVSASRPTFGKRAYNLSAVSYGGSFGTAGQDLMWEQRLSPRVSTQLSAAWLSSNGHYRFRYHTPSGYDTTATRRNDDITAVRAEAAAYGIMDKGDWTARAYVYSSHRGLPGAVVRNRFSNADRQRDVNSFAAMTLRQKFGSLSMLANVKLSYDYTHYLHGSRNGDGELYINNHYHQSGLYASCAWQADLTPLLQASLAADFALDALQADLRDFARPLRNSEYVSAAVAFSHNGLEAQANALLTCVYNKARNSAGGSSSRHTGFTPAFIASWTPPAMRALTLRAFFKRSYRLPTLNDLYYTFIGNSQLKPEYASQLSCGVTWRVLKWRDGSEGLTLKLDGYVNRVSNKIVAVPAANQFRWTMTNIGRVRIRGLDARAEWHISIGDIHAAVRGTYTRQRAEDRSDSSSPYYKGQIAYIPRNSASVTASAQWREWQLNYSFLHNGHRYDSSANIAANYLRPTNIHDIVVSRTFRLSSLDAKLALAVNNLLNRHFEVVRCYPMPGRNFKITLTINI